MPTKLMFYSVERRGMVVTAGVESAAVEKALALSAEQVCLVWTMLKAGTPIASSCRVVGD